MEDSSIVVTDITLNGKKLKGLDPNKEGLVSVAGNNSSVESTAVIEGGDVVFAVKDAANDSGDHVTVTLGVSDEPMSKTFKRDVNGQVVKEGAPQASVKQGFGSISFDSMPDFAGIVAELGSSCVNQ